MHRSTRTVNSGWMRTSSLLLRVLLSAPRRRRAVIVPSATTAAAAGAGEAPAAFPRRDVRACLVDHMILNGRSSSSSSLNMATQVQLTNDEDEYGAKTLPVSACQQRLLAEWFAAHGSGASSGGDDVLQQHQQQGQHYSIVLSASHSSYVMPLVMEFAETSCPPRSNSTSGSVQRETHVASYYQRYEALAYVFQQRQPLQRQREQEDLMLADDRSLRLLAACADVAQGLQLLCSDADTQQLGVRQGENGDSRATTISDLISNLAKWSEALLERLFSLLEEEEPRDSSLTVDQLVIEVLSLHYMDPAARWRVFRRYMNHCSTRNEAPSDEVLECFARYMAESGDPDAFDALDAAVPNVMLPPLLRVGYRSVAYLQSKKERRRKTDDEQRDICELVSAATSFGLAPRLPLNVVQLVGLVRDVVQKKSLDDHHNNGGSTSTPPSSTRRASVLHGNHPLGLSSVWRQTQTLPPVQRRAIITMLVRTACHHPRNSHYLEFLLSTSAASSSSGGISRTPPSSSNVADVVVLVSCLQWILSNVTNDEGLIDSGVDDDVNKTTYSRKRMTRMRSRTAMLRAGGVGGGGIDTKVVVRILTYCDEHRSQLLFSCDQSGSDPSSSLSSSSATERRAVSTGQVLVAQQLLKVFDTLDRLAAVHVTSMDPTAPQQQELIAARFHRLRLASRRTVHVWLHVANHAWGDPGTRTSECDVVAGKAEPTGSMVTTSGDRIDDNDDHDMQLHREVRSLLTTPKTGWSSSLVEASRRLLTSLVDAQSGAFARWQAESRATARVDTSISSRPLRSDVPSSSLTKRCWAQRRVIISEALQLGSCMGVLMTLSNDQRQQLRLAGEFVDEQSRHYSSRSSSSSFTGVNQQHEEDPVSVQRAVLLEEDWSRALAMFTLHTKRERLQRETSLHVLRLVVAAHIVASPSATLNRNERDDDAEGATTRVLPRLVELSAQGRSLGMSAVAGILETVAKSSLSNGTWHLALDCHTAAVRGNPRIQGLFQRPFLHAIRSMLFFSGVKPIATRSGAAATHALKRGMWSNALAALHQGVTDLAALASTTGFSSPSKGQHQQCIVHKDIFLDALNRHVLAGCRYAYLQEQKQNRSKHVGTTAHVLFNRRVEHPLWNDDEGGDNAAAATTTTALLPLVVRNPASRIGELMRTALVEHERDDATFGMSWKGQRRQEVPSKIERKTPLPGSFSPANVASSETCGGGGMPQELSAVELLQRYRYRGEWQKAVQLVVEGYPRTSGQRRNAAAAAAAWPQNKEAEAVTNRDNTQASKHNRHPLNVSWRETHHAMYTCNAAGQWAVTLELFSHLHQFAYRGMAFKTFSAALDACLDGGQWKTAVSILSDEARTRHACAVVASRKTQGSSLRLLSEPSSCVVYGVPHQSRAWEVYSQDAIRTLQTVLQHDGSLTVACIIASHVKHIEDPHLVDLIMEVLVRSQRWNDAVNYFSTVLSRTKSRPRDRTLELAIEACAEASAQHHALAKVVLDVAEALEDLWTVTGEVVEHILCVVSMSSSSSSSMSSVPLSESDVVMTMRSNGSTGGVLYGW